VGTTDLAIGDGVYKSVIRGDTAAAGIRALSTGKKPKGESGLSGKI